MLQKLVSRVILAVGVVTSAPAATAQTTDHNALQSSLDATNVSSPVKGLLVGGQPSLMDLEKIKTLGFETIISLRPVEEDIREINYDERAEAAKLGLDFVRIPIMSAMDLTPKNLSLLDMALAAAKGKAFVHCRTGNRVGAMLALRAFHMQNTPMSDAIALGEKAGLDAPYKAAIEEQMRGN